MKEIVYKFYIKNSTITNESVFYETFLEVCSNFSLLEKIILDFEYSGDVVHRRAIVENFVLCLYVVTEIPDKICDRFESIINKIKEELTQCDWCLDISTQDFILENVLDKVW